jgi:hypothetical protein
LNYFPFSNPFLDKNQIQTPENHNPSIEHNQHVFSRAYGAFSRVSSFQDMHRAVYHDEREKE